MQMTMRYPRTRIDAFNILANHKEDERNHFRATRSNDGVAFTTSTETSNHPDTYGEDVSHIGDPSTTSDLTTSTNPQQQQGSALVTTGGGRGRNRNGRGSAGRGRSITTCFRCGDTMPLPVLIPSRRPNDALQQPNLPDQMMTVGQPSNYSCQAVGTVEWGTLTLLTNSCRPPMEISKPDMVLTSPQNGFYSIANPLSRSSASGDSSRTSVNPMGGCTSIAMPGLPEQISWGISVAMVMCGNTRTASQTFSNWLKYASCST